MAQSAFARSNEVRAAWINVEPVLAQKKRGDRVTRAEIQLAAGHGFDARRLDPKVRAYFIKQGIDPIPIRDEGWLLPTDEEQVRDRALHHHAKAKRETKKEMHAAVSVDETALTPEARRLRDLHIRHAGGALALHKATGTERKAVLGAPPPRPKLEPVR